MKYFLSIVLTLLFNITYSQFSLWIPKKVGDRLYVTFPNNPSIDSKPNKRLTLFASTLNGSNCLFTVLKRTAAVPDYFRIMNLPEDQSRVQLNDFLLKSIKDLLKNDQILTPIVDNNIDRFLSKKVSYKMIDKKGKVTYQEARFILIGNTLYWLQVMSDINSPCTSEVNKFMKSIRVSN